MEAVNPTQIPGLSHEQPAPIKFPPALNLRAPSTLSLASRLKAQQAADHPPDDLGPLQRHPDLWFSDGSVVCRAEQTLFRVHMSQLGRHSICFRDMFAMPQPTRGANDCEGCPVVVLYDVAEDVANLFTALYDGPTFGNNDPEDFRVVSGILRLATKYMIDSLRTKALAHLSRAWPSTLKGWDAREDLARMHEVATATAAGHRFPSPLAVIALAREIDAPALLPAAFYDLSRYTFAQAFAPAPGEPLHTLTPAALARADVQRLALGKEAAQHAITALIPAMATRPPVHARRRSVCVSAAACRKDFSELVALATQHYLFDRERGCADPLYVADELGQLKGAEVSECTACAQSLETWAVRERERIWKLLPVWFRLDGSGTL